MLGLVRLFGSSAQGMSEADIGHRTSHPALNNGVDPHAGSDIRCPMSASDVPLEDDPNRRTNLNVAADVRYPISDVRCPEGSL